MSTISNRNITIMEMDLMSQWEIQLKIRDHIHLPCTGVTAFRITYFYTFSDYV